MPKVELPEEEIVCVRHLDGWCATTLKTAQYRQRIKTLCGREVALPWDIVRQDADCVDCAECRKRLGFTGRED